MAISLSHAGGSAKRSPFKVKRDRLTVVLVVLAILIMWEVAARTFLDGRFILAGPSDIIARLLANPGLYWRATMVTIREAALGFVWGNLAAILLAALIALVPVTERVAKGLALVVFCLPLVATGPVLRVLYGTSDGPQITLAALSVYYTTFIPLVVGLRAITQSWEDLVRSYGRGRWQMLLRVRCRASVPYLIAGLQIAAPAAVLGAMIGEFTGASSGLGVLVIQAMRTLDVEATWTVAVIATALAMTAYGLAGLLGRVLAGEPPALLLRARQGDAGARQNSASALLLTFILTTVITLGLWQGLMDLFDLNAFFAKRPGDVLSYLATATEAGAHRDELFQALGATLLVTVPGYLAGLALGMLLAFLFELAPTARTTMMPVAIALRSIPIITTAPLIILMLGRGSAGLITIVAVMIFFPTLVACMQGLRQAPGQIIDFFDVYAAGPVRKLALARVPAMLPAFFATARIAVPAAVLAATVAEWLSTGTGIGNLMALTYSTSNYNMLWSCVVVLTLVSVVGYGLVSLIERQVLLRVAPEQVASG